MKATLEFDLDEGEDIQSHLRCVHSLQLCLALHDMSQYFRGELKHNDNLTQDQYDVLEKARDKYFEILSSYGIDLDTLIS